MWQSDKKIFGNQNQWFFGKVWKGFALNFLLATLLTLIDARLSELTSFKKQ